MAQSPIDGKFNIGPSEPTPDSLSSGNEEDGQGFEQIAKAMPSTPVQKPSPMTVAQNSQPSMQAGQVNAENFVANIQQVMQQMQGLQVGLQTPNLKLNARTSRLLDAKLKRANENIQFIHSKANVGEEGDQEDESSSGLASMPVGDGKDNNKAVILKFVNYLTDGQSQLESAIHGVSHSDGKQSPQMRIKDMFAMQVKLYRAQVEIEFSTAVLQKAIDDLKTLMNVQL